MNSMHPPEQNGNTPEEDYYQNFAIDGSNRMLGTEMVTKKNRKWLVKKYQDERWDWSPNSSLVGGSPEENPPMEENDEDDDSGN